MDYEKKYKEALNWMKDVYPTLEGAAKEDAEHYFPELKESEDEKIRKAIRTIILSEPDIYKKIGFSQSDCLVWIEKQGKNNMGISEATKQKLEDNLNHALEKETPESCNEFLEKQGEQKSIEGTFVNVDDVREDFMQQVYSILDADATNDRANLIIDAFDNLPSITISEQDQLILANYTQTCKDEQKPDTDFSDLRTWKYIVDAVLTEKEGIGQYLDSPFIVEVAEKLQKRFGNIQQKTAWSEADNINYKRLLYFLDGGILMQDHNIELSIWMESLKERVQSQQKQEWSEEDKKLFGLLHTCVCRCITDPYWDSEKRKNISKNIPPFLDKLKTLKAQSQWKPSDAQMIAIQESIGIVGELTPRGECLKELEEQLKKLREE